MEERVHFAIAARYVQRNRRSKCAAGVAFALSVFGLVSLATGCRESTQPVVVRVFFDTSGPSSRWVRDMISQFSLERPRVADGRPIMIATYETHAYGQDLGRLSDLRPQLVILSSPSDADLTGPAREQLGSPLHVCSERISDQAYIPEWVSSRDREAADIFLRYLVAHPCQAGP